jgi:hypothetical protein
MIHFLINTIYFMGSDNNEFLVSISTFRLRISTTQDMYFTHPIRQMWVLDMKFDAWAVQVHACLTLADNHVLRSVTSVTTAQFQLLPGTWLNLSALL